MFMLFSIARKSKEVVTKSNLYSIGPIEGTFQIQRDPLILWNHEAATIAKH